MNNEKIDALIERMNEDGYGRRIPKNGKSALALYIIEHIPPGSFLEAVLSNDLASAIGHADHININLLEAYVGYLYNNAPSLCWGSKKKFENWIKKA